MMRGKIDWREWTEEETFWLKENYAFCDPKEAEEKCGRSWSAIINKARAMNLHRNTKSGKPRLTWKTEEEKPHNISKARDNECDYLALSELAKMMGISTEDIDGWHLITTYDYKGRECVHYAHLGRFLRNNQDKWDATNIIESWWFEMTYPAWYPKKKRNDYANKEKRRWGMCEGSMTLARTLESM